MSLIIQLKGKNAEKKLPVNLKNQAHIRIPKVYWEFSSKKILAMEFMDGIKLNSPQLLHAKGYDSKRIAERLMNAILHQIFIKGFFSCGSSSRQYYGAAG